MAGIGKGENGANKQSRKLPTTTSYALRDVRQSLKQLQVGGHATTDQIAASVGLNNDGQMAPTWNINSQLTDKRSTRHAKALMEIRSSLQSYEVCGEVDKILLERCVALGFDEVSISVISFLELPSLFPD